LPFFSLGNSSIYQGDTCRHPSNHPISMIMAQDGDRFEPRLGRSRRDTVRAPTTLRTALMDRVARAGGNPRRLPSILRGASAQRAPSPSPGRFNARGRGAKIAAGFLRRSG
jgi:hypothetical protein